MCSSLPAAGMPSRRRLVGALVPPTGSAAPPARGSGRSDGPGSFAHPPQGSALTCTVNQESVMISRANQESAMISRSNQESVMISRANQESVMITRANQESVMIS